MDQVEEEESLYRSLEEEAIDVDCLLVEPRSDQVSVSGVWCFEEDNLGKCMKTEDISYQLGVQDSNINVEGVNTTKLNALDVLPHEAGVENLLAANGVSPCDDYLLDIGFVDHGPCIDCVSNEGLHMRNSSSETESHIPVFNTNDKGSFGIQNSFTETILGSQCQNYFLGNCVFETSTADNKSSIYASSFESKSLNSYEDVSVNEDNLQHCFAPNGTEVTPLDHGVGAVAQKRSRKPTKRYIDESSSLILKNCKKRREASSVSKVKIPKIRWSKHHFQLVEPKEKVTSSEIPFCKAIQVPFDSQGPAECQKNDLSTAMETHVENYASGSEDEDDSEMAMRSLTGGNQRKLHRLWTVSEVKKLIDGVAHFGVGKWTHIKKLLFSSSIHRTPVDLKDKWRNLLKASRALKGSRIEDEQKRSQPWRPLPKSILCRVRELASAYPYPREGNSKISKSKFPLARHVSSPARIKGNNQVSVL